MPSWLGHYDLQDQPVHLNVGRRTERVVVRNTGDRPIQVGSHFHFFESNKALEFERAKAFGMRLNIPAGTAVRFEPGDSREVELVEFGGTRQVFGFNNLATGSVDQPAALANALSAAAERGFRGSSPGEVSDG